MKSIELINDGEVGTNSQTESTISFTHKSHPILIETRLNHSRKKYTFILDTGALTLVREHVAKELNLPKGIEVNAGGTGGNTKTINLVKLNNIIVGGIEVANCAVGVTNFSPLFPSKIDGIIGSNFLKYFKITINYQEKTLLLSQNTTPTAIQDEEIKIPIETDIKSGFSPLVKCVLVF